MEGYLRKYGWAIRLGFVIIVATLLAFIASGIVAVFLAPYRVPVVDLSYDSSQTQNTPTAMKVSPQEMARVIEQRCLFAGCPTSNLPAPCNPPCSNGQICDNGACVDDPNAKNNSDSTLDGIPIESTSGIRLLGIIVAKDYPRYSTVIMTVPGSPVSVIGGIGDTVAGAEIKEIYRDRIILDNNGRLEYVRLDNTLQGNPSAGRTFGNSGIGKNLVPPPPPTPTNPSDTPQPVAAAAPGLYEENGKIPPRTIALDREEMQQTFRNPMELVKEANILPHYDKKGPSGVTISRIPPQLSRFGLQSGDIVKKINGRPITTQISAFEALRNLKTANSLQIDVERNGKHESLNYTIK